MLLLQWSGQETVTLQIDGYEIREKLGEGGMASVWLARQRSLDRLVAIKVLSRRFAANEDDVRRFLDEAQSAAKLKHPGIVQVHDSSAVDGEYYIVMEYVAGYTVGDWVRRKGVLAEKDALLVGECVADALGYAWERVHLIHCDIKPDNLIIDEDGTVKVADLGLSRTLMAMDVSDEAESEVMGTPAYMSPEQAKGDPNIDFRTDIYALGAVLYHLATGKMPFMGSTEDETLEQQVVGTIDDPIDVNRELSNGICWLIERMMAKDPKHRHSSWEEVREDILRVRRGLLPANNSLPAGASTVKRSANRITGPSSPLQRAKSRATTGKPGYSKRILFGLGFIVLMVGLLWLQHNFSNHKPASSSPVRFVSPPVYNPSSSGKDSSRASSGDREDGERNAREMFGFAVQWHERHPDDYNGSIRKFEIVAQEARGTKYQLMAQQRIRDLRDSLSQEIKRVAHELEEQAESLVDSGRFDEAISMVESYDEAYARHTHIQRQRLVDSLKRQKRVWEQEQSVKRKEQAETQRRLTETLVLAVLSDDLNLALQQIKEMQENEAFGDVDAELADVDKVLRSAIDLDTKIADSFEAQRGEVITIQLNDGPLKVKVGPVRGTDVVCYQDLDVGRGATRSRMISVDDLAPVERLQRMGSESSQEVALVKGIMAFNSRAYSHAESYFRKTHPFLARHLCAKLSGNSSSTD